VNRIARSFLPMCCAAGLLFAQGPPHRKPPRRPPPGPAAIERFNNLPPGQRERLLERLPPERRREFESRVERYNRLSPAEKERLRESYDRFSQLPPDRRDEARRVFARFRLLPEERQALIQAEIHHLGKMTPEARQDYVDSQEFRDKFSPEERRIIRDFGRAFAPREDSERQEL
jgi:hypothetical protein